MTLNSPAVAELMAEAGFDWLFIDAEHSTLDTSQMQSLLQAAAPTPCVIRLASGDDVPIKKALDIAAAGIIVPQVNSAEHGRCMVGGAMLRTTVKCRQPAGAASGLPLTIRSCSISAR